MPSLRHHVLIASAPTLIFWGEEMRSLLYCVRAVPFFANTGIKFGAMFLVVFLFVFPIARPETLRGVEGPRGQIKSTRASGLEAAEAEGALEAMGKPELPPLRHYGLCPKTVYRPLHRPL